MLAVFWKSGRPRPVIAGMIVSLVCMIVVSQVGWTESVGGVQVLRKVFWPWYTLIGTAVTILTALAVARAER